MRKVLVAALALSPMMLHAQAASPAPTQTTVSALVQPKTFEAATGSSVPTAPIRISTGVTAPKLISTVAIEDNRRLPIDQLAIVSMVVDATGKPTELKLVKSAGSTVLDQNVLSAVGQYRFAPGTLNNQPTAIPLNLEITLRHAGL